MAAFYKYKVFTQDSELMELRETIEAMKAKNEEAQAVIHGALNNPENMKGLKNYPHIMFFFFFSIFKHQLPTSSL